ncbi:TonB-dependent receptor plug domain-containing protein [Solitalea canadensis]|uniref:Outer membrane receptor for ferrienterochelin and colicins n=1 Tax=Solitalea canadensis (strain ATCC 29591 / DSM 3403 / JCM 21819 / LMG 8368 / NBRC 15130 / NCIMB 12057 / USAM 9D) TaxID=929556 RepID=H8KN79_SOLCM|nr:TonB-dependent receptor [Solitalea canadensis]AFD09412.1 outer membrane receptor for ferrienterochelin and colicins [Solitalea canadensis DSM 3403]
MNKFYYLIGMTSLSMAANAQTVDSLPVTERVFKLGEVVVSGKKNNETSILTNEKIEMFNQQDASGALNLLPGINLSKVGARNESVVLVRGFDLRQVPVFIDGIPVYVPYDGYVDLGRFTTFDISQINVAKGFSSVTFGANTLGGAINIVSRRPLNKFEIDASAGLMNSEGHRLGLNMGSKVGRFYVQGSVSQLKQQSYLLSSDFIIKPLEDGNDRNNAYRNDNKYTIKVGFTPRRNDEYALSYMKQDGQKGNPPYVGNDPLQKARFWQWPYWNKESVYFISSTGITGNSAFKTRLYYDKFKNQLNAYDDATYSTQTKPSSFQSFYDDDTYGGGLEYDAQLIQKHLIKTFIQYKNDRHKEHNLGEPIRTYRDYTISAGVEDSYKVSDKLILTPGVSFNLRGSLQAQDYNSSTKEIADYPENNNNTFNVQLGAVYQFNDFNKLNASVARKSRFATIKDRYSYRMGAAIPNPDLKAEMANHYEVGYSGRLISKLGMESSVFYSRISDAIQQVNNVKPNTYQLQNTGKAAFYGAELSLKYDILNNWYTVAQYSYLHRDNLSNKEIKFTDAPENKMVVYSQYSFNSRFSVLAGTEYNSARYSTSYGTKADEFAIVNLGVQAKIYRWVSAEAGANNVFDKNYSISEGYPEPGRNCFVSLVINNIK